MKIYVKLLWLWVAKEASKGVSGEQFSLNGAPRYQDVPLEGADHCAAVGASGRLAQSCQQNVLSTSALLTFTRVALNKPHLSLLAKPLQPSSNPQEIKNADGKINPVMWYRATSLFDRW